MIRRDADVPVGLSGCPVRARAARTPGFLEWSSKMRNRLMGAILIGALASSTTACGTASSKPFDPHDLSGFWEITNIGLAAGALNSTSNTPPPLTPAGLERFRKTKTGEANALSNGSFPNEADWNDPIRWCDPTGFPRILWNP